MNAEDLRMAMVERFRDSVERGDGDALLEAVSTAATLGVAMPTWLASALTRAVAAYRNFEVRTLDEAFGVQRAKGQRQDAVQSEGSKAIYVIAEVLRLHAQGTPIDAGIFEAAGATCDVGKTTAQDWFYKHKKQRTNTYLVAMQMAGVTEG
ncbi:hypothetical protein [Pseudoxanthomonas mexicana]|uniref:hypothetical protein n=1 Tax=Pseudoxanthomonas mexicana TaxID=128785 RepID=UPI00138A1B9A|nr:hypothetical protein [Pseudoxanthomonas mexicana]